MILERITGTFKTAFTCQLLPKFNFIYYCPPYSNGKDVLSEGEIQNNTRCLWCYSFNLHFLACTVLELLLFLLLISKWIEMYIHSKHNEQLFLFKCHIYTNSKTLASKTADQSRWHTLRGQTHKFYGSVAKGAWTGNTNFPGPSLASKRSRGVRAKRKVLQQPQSCRKQPVVEERPESRCAMWVARSHWWLGRVRAKIIQTHNLVS